MAYERGIDNKIKGDSLDAFVSNLSTTFNTQMKVRNAEDELKFNDAVINEGFDLDEQLSYRQEQFKRVKDDPSERARIKGEINSLKQRIEQKEFSDAYLEKLMNYESGISSIDSVISYLKDQKTTATDSAILETIDKELRTKQAEKFSLSVNLIKDQTDYAVKDKSVQVIDEQISKVGLEKNKALLAGNDTLVQSYNLQLQALNKAKTESSINRDIKNFAASTITGYASATGLLDAYNSKISGAADNTPITIGDVTYSSAKEFWTFKRDSYLADNSSSGLFSRLNTEVSDKIKVAASKNNLDTNLLQTYTKDISSLTGRPELAGYETKIDATKQDLLQTGANLLTDKITDKYAIDYDLNKAVGELNGLKAIGVNIDSAYAKIIVAGANVKSNQVNSILNAAQNALVNDPNLTPEMAITTAIQSGAGLVQSPQDLTETPAGDIAKDLSTTTSKEATTNTNDPKLSAPQVTPTQNTPTPATPAGASGYKTITVNPGETLSQIAARELGSASKFNEIATLNNITNPNKISAGAVLKIPVKAPVATQAQATTPTPTSQPTQQTPKPTQTPAPTPSPQPAPTPTPQPPKSTYQGSSIVDYLGTVGQDSSYSARKNLAASKGIANYSGTAAQNTQLLKTLRGF